MAEYRFGGGVRVIAKLYSDAAEGFAIKAIHDALWEKGFGAGSPYRVPEPIGYLPEYGILLMHVAPGEALREVQPRSWAGFKEGLIGAARWLAALHSWPHRVGPAADASDTVSSLERLRAEAAASRPSEADFFEAASHELRRRYDSIREAKTRVQTHGRYHIDHVFLAPECVTVVDMDRVGVSEAARDIGEFLHRLRWEAARMRVGKTAMNEATAVFLAEYVRQTDSDLSSLLYHWSYSIYSMLLRSVSKPRPAGRSGDKRLRHLRREFDRVPRFLATWRRRD
ncbi:MAG: aminoglycoside phosphotransferase family protein [Actinomycetota bacterium]|nr:aminoglycoside phosphotransferase family protein [Actinomycetota bacterium]